MLVSPKSGLLARRRCLRFNPPPLDSLFLKIAFPHNTIAVSKQRRLSDGDWLLLLAENFLFFFVLVS